MNSGVDKLLAEMHKQADEHGVKINSQRVESFLQTKGAPRKVDEAVFRDMVSITAFLDNLQKAANFLFDKYGDQVKAPREFWEDLVGAGLSAQDSTVDQVTASYLTAELSAIEPAEYTILKSIVVHNMADEIESMAKQVGVYDFFQTAMKAANKVIVEMHDAKARKGQ